MKFFYGQFEHLACEAWPKSIEYRALKTDRGLRYGTNVRFEVGIEAKIPDGQNLTQANMDARVDAITDAYSLDYKDAGFRLDNGAVSDHYIQSSSAFNLTGNRVKEFFWHNKHPTEHFNIRSGTVVVEATFETSYSDIMEMHETIDYQGSLDAEKVFRRNWSGGMFSDELYQSGKQTIVQSGFIRYKNAGLFSSLALPSPWLPANEIKSLRRKRLRSGVPWGNLHRERFHSKIATYRYVMVLESDTAYEPSTYLDL